MIINNNYNDINDNYNDDINDDINDDDNENTTIIDFQALILLSFAFFISTIYYNSNYNIINYI